MTQARMVSLPKQGKAVDGILPSAQTRPITFFLFGGVSGACHVFKLRELANLFRPRFPPTFVQGKVIRSSKLHVISWNNIVNKVICCLSIGVSVLTLFPLVLLWILWRNLVLIALGASCAIMFGVDKNVLFHGMAQFTRVLYIPVKLIHKGTHGVLSSWCFGLPLPFIISTATFPLAVPLLKPLSLWMIVLLFPGMLKVWLVDLMRGLIGAVLRVFLKTNIRLRFLVATIGSIKSCRIPVYLTSIPRICVV